MADQILGGEAPRPQGPGDHRSDASQGEDPVHGQTSGRIGLPEGDLVPQSVQFGPEFGEPLPCDSAHHDDRSSRVAGRLEELLHVRPGQLRKLAIDHVHLCEGDETGGDAQEFDDAQMLPRLRHHPIIGGHHQQEQVDAGRSRDHGLDEALVTGNVHHAEMPATGQRQLREAQLDADAPLLLFLEPVGVPTRQCFDECRLAVVDVAGRTEGERSVSSTHPGAHPTRRVAQASGPDDDPGAICSIAQARLSATASIRSSARASTSR